MEVSRIAAHPDFGVLQRSEGVPGESKSAGVDESATSVLKQMLGAYERSGAQAVADSPKQVTFDVNAAACKLYVPK